MTFNWRRELLTLATLAMEASWTYAWLRLLFHASGGGAGQYLTLGSCFLLLFLATYTGRLLAADEDAEGEDGIGRERMAMLGVMALAVLIVVHGPLFPQIPIWNPGWVLAMLAALGRVNLVALLAIIASLLLWHRGLEHAQGGFSVESTGFRFRLGVIAFIWLLLVETFVPIESLTPLLFGFFAISLLAMALARIEEVSNARAGIPSPFNRAWLAIVVGATLAAMLIAGSAAQILSLAVVHRLLGMLEPVLRLLDPIIYWALYWLILILVRLLEPLAIWLARALQGALANSQLALPSGPPPPPTGVEGPVSFPPEVLQLLVVARWVLIAALIVFVALLVVSAMTRRRRAYATGVPELRESVWSAKAFADDLAGLLARARRRLRAGAGVRGRLRQVYAAATIRQTYASLCRWAAAQGIPRPAPNTPYEYLPALVAALPDREGELRLITEAYVRVHYGEAPTQRAELEAVRQAWQRVQASQVARPA